MGALLDHGHPEVVDADLAYYFGSIPHAELLKSVTHGRKHARAQAEASAPKAAEIHGARAAFSFAPNQCFVALR